MQQRDADTVPWKNSFVRLTTPRPIGTLRMGSYSAGSREITGNCLIGFDFTTQFYQCPVHTKKFDKYTKSGCYFSKTHR